MKPAQTLNQAQLSNPPLGKKPNLSQKQLKNLRLILQFISIPQPKVTYFYNIVQKQSKMGFSSNQRLLILNVQQRSISYLSKIPQGYLPFTNYDQITANKVKQKCLFNQAQNIKCLPLKGKISTLTLEWLDKQKNQKKWTITLNSSKLMNDWMSLINSVIDGSYDKEKYQQMSKINSTSPLTSNNIIAPQNNQSNLQNKPNLINPSNITQQAPLNNNQPPLNIINAPVNNNLPKTQQPPIKYQPFKPTQTSQNPFLQDGKNQGSDYNTGTQPTLPKNGSSNNLPNPSIANTKIPPNVNSNSINNPSNINNQPNLLNSNITNTQPLNSSNSNNNLPNSANQQSKPNAFNSNLSNGNLPNSNVSNITNPNVGNSNLISNGQSYIKPQTNLLAGETQISRKPKIPKMGQSAMAKFNNQEPINANPSQNNFSSSPINVGDNQNIQNLGSNSRMKNPPYTHPNDINFDSGSNPNNQNNTNSRTLLNNSSQQPGDFVQELKRKRQKNPEKFILNNELSQKKFQDNNSPNSPQYHQPSYPGYYQSNQNNQQSFQGRNPSNRNLSQRVASQKYLNRQNSGDKKNVMKGLQSPNSKFQQDQQISQPFSRTKTNSNIKSIGNLNGKIANQSSKSHISNKQLEYIPSSGLDNNYDDLDAVVDDNQDNYQIYKPTTNFPQSTKNLNKIRSDYLQRKSEHIGNINTLNQDKPYPSTAKNDARLLKNNYMQDRLKNSRDHKFNQLPFDKLPKFDSTQRKRQDSMNNLSKVSNVYPSSNRQKSFISYNDLWLQTSNPNKKLQIHDQFINRSRQLVKQIVQQIPYPKSQREFQPVDSYDKENIYTFLVENLIIKLHFFNQQQSINGSEDNINMDAPVLYDHSTYEQIKRQFYNYNLILGVTSNEGKIKVPLCCYVQYRGILAVVKADIPQAYSQVQPYAYKQQFQALQNMIKVRFLFNTFNCYESQGYRGGQGRFIVVWNLKNLIPGIPNSLKDQNSYFRKELLLQYDQILEDLQSSSQAHAFTLKHIVPQLLTKLESLQIQILHSKDLTREFHRAGLSLSYLPQMYKRTQSAYLKKIFMSETVVGIFTEVVRSQLNHAFAILPAQNMQNVSSAEVNNVIVACAHVLVNQFFSYTSRSENIWKLIVNQASKRYRMIVSKQDVIPGYLLSGIVHKLNLESDFKQKSFLKQKKFFVHENIIPRQVFITFTPRVRRFDMQSVCPTYSKCKQLLESEEVSLQNYEHISMILNLKNRTTQFPQYYDPLLQKLKTYLANYIPYTLEQEYEHLDVYEFMYEQPITFNCIKTAFLAIKWLIKSNQIQKANQVFEIKFHQLSYWINEYNTAITQFYDFFAMFYASIGDFEQSICLAKSSLINMTKVLGPGALPVADKHYQLGNIYYKINKKNEALKQYNKTKQILINYQKTTIAQFGIILLKISLLCLNFGELTQCLSNAIQAQRIFQNNGGNQNEQIQCFQILSRVYQITRKPSDMNNLCQACSKTFNSTQNPRIMQRMLKIIIHPKLSQLSSQQQKSLLPILIRLQQGKLSAQLYLQSFNYIHRLGNKNNIKRKIYYYLQNVVILADQINRRDLIRKHTSFNQKTNGQAQEMLVILQAIGSMIGWGFLVGALKQGLYD